MEPLFSLFAEDNEKYTDFCAWVRESIPQFSPKNLKVENLMSEISNQSWSFIAEFVKSMATLDYRIEFNVQNADPITELEELSEFLSNLPITTLLFLEGSDSFIDPYRFTYNDEFFSRFSDFKEKIISEGNEVSEEQIHATFDQKGELEALYGIKIKQALLEDENGDDIHRFICECPDCNWEGDSFEEFVDHINSNHEDNLSGLKLIWGNIIRWLRMKGEVPTIKQMFKPLFVGVLTLNHDDTSDEHLFFDKEKFDRSVDAASRWEHEISNVSYDTQTSIAMIHINIAQQGIINDFLTSQLPQGSITWGSFENMTYTNEQIAERYDPNFVFTKLGEEIENSIDVNSRRSEVDETKIGEFIQFITESIKNLRKVEDINQFIINELNVDFESGLNDTLATATDVPVIISFMAKHKWVPMAGIASPIPGDNQIFNTVQKMIGTARKYYKLNNKMAIDRNMLYYYPILGEGKWMIKIEDEEKPRTENLPFVCCFSDCDYHNSSEKQRFEHQKNGVHVEAQQRTPEVGPFWMALIDYTNKHNELPTIETIIRPRETFVCEECGACFCDTNAVSQHLFKKHKITNTRTTGQHILHGQIVWVSKEEEIQLMQEANRQRIIELARPIVRQGANNQTQDQRIAEQQRGEHATEDHQASHPQQAQEHQAPPQQQSEEHQVPQQQQSQEHEAPQPQQSQEQQAQQATVAQIRNEEEQQNTHDGATIQQQAAPNATEAEVQNRQDVANQGQQQQQIEREEAEEEVRQRESDLEENLGLLDANNEISNEALVNTARDWIMRFSQEEDRTIGIPTLTVERRKLVKRDLKTLYTTVIIPLIERFMPHDDSEDEKMKLDGLILKIAHELRMHCKNKLSLTERGMFRNSQNNRASNMHEEDTEAKKLLSLSADSASAIKHMNQMRTIQKIQEQTQTLVNKYEKAKDKLITIMNNRSEEWNREVFGGNTAQHIVDTISLDEQQFERRVDWLRSVIDNSASKVTKAKMKIRNMYDDCPRKCLNRYVWPKTTPECPLSHEDFKNHYGREWATEVINYTNPVATDEYNIDETIAPGSDERFAEHMKNEKRIMQIIASRNYISAHGKDGLSNALYRMAKQEATTMFKLIFKAILVTKHIPTSWTKTKTIMLYKKSDPNQPGNWRPIGITSTMYRVLTAHISAFINIENMKNDVFHPSQRGFIGGKGNGAHDHINTLNELITHAKRTNSKCVLTAIDLTNAFGSVPHQLIFDTLKQKGFGSTFRAIIEDLYANSETSIEVKGQRSEAIKIRRGVIQGCPLSPLLFNCCIDPLLTHLERFNFEDGITLEYNNGPFTVTAQAYADDLVLISKSKEAAENMINALTTYCNRTSLIIAPKKCISIVEGYEEVPQLSIAGNVLSVIKSGEAIKYLGAPITGRKSTKFAQSDTLIEDARNKTKLVFNSQLSLSQKVHAVKSYILPTLDYILTNSSCKVSSLARLDSFIRGMIMKGAETQRIPKEFAHIPSRNGGLGIPNLQKKGDMMKIENYISSLLSNNKKISDMATLFTLEEKDSRGIVEDNESKRFFNWAFGGDTGNAVIQSHSNRGTDCAAIKAMHACISNDINLYMEDGSKMILSHNGISKRIVSIKNAKEALREFVCKDLLESIKDNRTHGHSFTGPTTKESHPFRNTVPINDSIFKFIIKGRTNTLPTEGNIYDWTGNGNGICKHCGEGKETLHHLLNNCKHKMQFYTYRHNIVANILRDAIRVKINPEYYKESCQVSLSEITDGRVTEGISPNNTHLRPDIIYMDSDNELTVIEIGVAYNQERNKDGVVSNTLEDKHKEKNTKYASLMNEIRTATNMKVNYYSIIASSLGHITEETLHNLATIFGIKKARKIADDISLKVIMCSKCIYNNISPKIYGLPTSTWPGRTETSHNISNSTSDGVSNESNSDSIVESNEENQQNHPNQQNEELQNQQINNQIEEGNNQSATNNDENNQINQTFPPTPEIPTIPNPGPTLQQNVMHPFLSDTSSSADESTVE